MLLAIVHRYSCTPGTYQAGGSSLRTCSTSSGVWSGSDLQCAACVAPDAPTNGVRSCDGATSHCTYSCAPGFFQSGGTSARYCDAVTGSWSGSAVTCAACADPSAGVGVELVSCSSGTCTQACASGYYRTGGDSVRTCSTSSGAYSGSALTCAACVAPSTPTGGTRVCSADGSQCTYSCAAGYYRTAGSDTRTCAPESGAWSGIALQCQQCTAPAPGHRVARSCTVPGTCVYSCTAGSYHSGGTAERTCSITSGAWSGSEFQCTVCTAPVPPQHSTLACDADTYRCTAACDGGHYRSAGSVERLCVDGAWTGTSLTCTACAEPAAGAHVQLVSCSGGSCTQQCGTGWYAAAGNTVRHCSPDTGAYSGADLVCAQCTPPPAGSDVQRLCSADQSSCTYECTSEFAVVVAGAEHTPRLCSNADGAWSGDDLVCSQCTSPPSTEALVDVNCAAGSCALACTPGAYVVL